MSRYLLSIMPTSLFALALSLGIWSKGSFSAFYDGGFLALFILSHFKAFNNVLVIAGCTILLSWVDGFSHLLSSFSMGLSIYCISFMYFTFLKDREESMSDQKQKQFFEKLARNNMQTIADLKDQLDTLCMQPINSPQSFIDEDLNFFQADYDESLDLLETRLQQELDERSKLEKKPLRRLRRVVMKQTSFLDGPESLEG